MLRYLLEQGVGVIFSSKDPRHVADDIDLFDFALTV